ncbi:MerC domain-containing protein [Roseiconus lacunae]|uniref:MerC domain-containing protein n=1 Tax=Roseiconus lacunae TaxID=2605694 RepID=UPI0011F23828|nr:MerC domain-containing protein [Roseiconus lacunae]
MSGELLVINPGEQTSGGQNLAGESASTGLASWGDWAGMVASIGCAIHCAAMPFVIAYLPALGLSFLADEAFHQWMAVACFAIALTAFVPGLRKHGRLTPVLIGSVGLVMISVAAFGFAGDCCAACESGATSAVTEPSGAIAGDTAAEACTEACCAHCAADKGAVTDSDSAVNSDVAKTDYAGIGGIGLPVDSAWVGRIAPWLTPLGGIILVVAHLLNRRYGCLCGCCPTPSESAPAESV